MSEASDKTSSCAMCMAKACCTDDPSHGPSNCTMVNHRGQYDHALKLYLDDPEINEMILASDRMQMRGDQKWTRVECLVDFARQMGYKKLGIAFCGGLSYEARVLTKILENKGFSAVSVSCKSGALSKLEIGLPESEVAALQVKRDLGGLPIKLAKYEPSCNPVGQALVLNAEGTDFNIIVGLCVGHDTLFIRHSKAPVTVLVAQDSRLFHNPVAALHGTNSIYFAKLMSPGHP